MELTAIYHRPESEYAYLYKDGQLHIRIRTKKEDIKRIVLHYGDPPIQRGTGSGHGQQIPTIANNQRGHRSSPCPFPWSPRIDPL